MAEMILKTPKVHLNTVDLSSFVRSVTINLSKELQDKTASGSSGRSFLSGLRAESFTIEFNQDFTASKVDATLYTIYQASTGKAFSLFNNTTSTGAGNIKWSGTCMLENYSPLDGTVGDLVTVSPPFKVNGVVTRTTL